MTDQNIERYLQDIINPDKTGLPAIIAMTKLKRALKKGAVIPREYDKVTDEFWAQKRAGSLKVMAIDAWNKSQDENLDIDTRLKLLNAIEGHKNKGDFEWETFGINASGFYNHKLTLQVHKFHQDHDAKSAHYLAGAFDQAFESKFQKLIESGEVSETDANKIKEHCKTINIENHDKKREKHLKKHAELSARANNEALPFADRLQAIHDAQREIRLSLRPDNDDAQRLADNRKQETLLFNNHFKAQYDIARQGKDALKSYHALVNLWKHAEDNGYDDDTLSISYEEFKEQQNQLLYKSADALIEMTSKMAQEGDAIGAYAKFGDYFHIFAIEELQKEGYDLTKINDQVQHLLALKIKSEFDEATTINDPDTRAFKLREFAHDGYKGGEDLDNLFGKDEADRMRNTARDAFISAANYNLLTYMDNGNIDDLYTANGWRDRASAQWTEVTNNIQGLEDAIERNGHQSSHPDTILPQ